MTIHPISVIVCTHNRANLLPKVICQLRAQNYPRDSFEIIVVDNCCTDQTPQVVQRFNLEGGAPLRYVKENQPGVTFARNRGAQEARYPYLAYLDDDCSVQPDWLSQLVSGFDLDERVSVVAGRVAPDYDDQQIPAWLGPKSERWLASYNHPGSHPRLLANPGYVIEGNMALKRTAWESADGFLGMDQFGSPHMASQEIVHLLKHVERQGDQVAFVPGAFAHHHVGIRTWGWFVKRAYWHGISDGILDYFLYRRSSVSVAYCVILDTTAMFIFLCLALLFLLLIDRATAMYQLLRATARFGKILSQLRLTGDWRRVRAWAANHPYGMKNEALL